VRKILSVAAVLALAGFLPVRAMADTCIGNCGGPLGANGVVSASRFSSDYQFISTSGGVHGAGRIAGVGANETDKPVNGSEFFTSSFPAAAGDNLDFFFNYVTSDGAGFSDYSFAELLSGSLAQVAWLFTARTQEIGNASPGFGLPATIRRGGSALARHANARRWCSSEHREGHVGVGVLVKQPPDDLPARLTLALAYQRRGKPAEARTELLERVRRDPLRRIVQQEE